MSPGHAEQAKSDIGNKKAAVSLNADASWLNKKSALRKVISA
jgi:hypothetical protein